MSTLLPMPFGASSKWKRRRRTADAAAVVVVALASKKRLILFDVQAEDNYGVLEAVMNKMDEIVPNELRILCFSDGHES